MKRISRLVTPVVLCVLAIMASPAYGVELAIMDSGTSAWHDMFMEIVKRYEATQPGVKINYQITGAPLDALDKAAVMIAGGSAPELVWGSVTSIERFAASGLPEDLGPWIARDRWDVSMLPAPSVEGYKRYLPGQLIALPRYIQHHALFYNADMFGAAGTALPGYEWTWADLQRVARSLTRDTDGDGQNDEYGFHFHGWIANPTFYMPVLHAFGGRIYSAERTKTDLHNPDTIRAFTMLQSLHVTDGVSPASDPNGKRAAGKVAMWYANTLDIPTYKFGFGWGLAPLPKERQGHGIGTTDVAWWIPKDSRNKELAWDFLKFFLSRDIQRLISDHGYVSPRRDTMGDAMRDAPPEVRNMLVRNLMNSNVNSLGLLAGPWHADNYTILTGGLGQIQQGKKPVEQIFAEIAPLIDANLAKPWPPK
jgi:multiple sugar transport system substrate-binding protein